MDTISDLKQPAAPRRRRSYTEALRQRILEEAAQPGVSVASVARRHGINDNVIFNWRQRRLLRPARMLPVVVTRDSAGKDTEIFGCGIRPCFNAGARIEIRTAQGHVIQIGARANARMVRVVLAALRA